jgi:DNA topoisomerase IA
MKTSKSDLAKILRLNGFIMPSSDEEIRAFEEKYKKSYEKPENWNSPLEVIKKGKIKKVNLEVTKNNSAEANNLAMAAREGKSISKEVKNKLKQDRENVKKK